MKSDVMQPNILLRQERQQRGWTRAYVAEQIGVADPKTIGRWEQGRCRPSEYFLQRLCALYERTPAELGLLPYYEEETKYMVPHPSVSSARTTLHSSSLEHALAEFIDYDGLKLYLQQYVSRQYGQPISLGKVDAKGPDVVLIVVPVQQV